MSTSQTHRQEKLRWSSRGRRQQRTKQIKEFIYLIRLICNADRLAHTNAMFKISILKLSEFVKYKTAIVMFNVFHGVLPIQLQRKFFLLRIVLV